MTTQRTDNGHSTHIVANVCTTICYKYVASTGLPLFCSYVGGREGGGRRERAEYVASDSCYNTVGPCRLCQPIDNKKETSVASTTRPDVRDAALGNLDSLSSVASTTRGFQSLPPDDVRDAALGNLELAKLCGSHSTGLPVPRPNVRDAAPVKLRQ